MKYNIMQPVMAKQFRCMMDKCPATCCSGWSVCWSRKEILTLKSRCAGNLAEMCESAFPQINEYTPVKMNMEDNCPFLKGGLCEIHRTLGEEYLSYTCREYPRITALVGDELIRSCKLTCFGVVERLISEELCMQLEISPAQDGEISAIIASPQRTEQQKCIEIAQKLLWNEALEIHQALLMAAESFGIEEQGNILPFEQCFRDIFGWELIIASTENEKAAAEKQLNSLCKNAVRNIIKALFMEWQITGYSDELAAADNFCCFMFSAAIMINAVYGAAAFTESREEFICTVSDIAGVLYSDKCTAVRIAEYLRKNKLCNKKIFSYIFK